MQKGFFSWNWSELWNGFLHGLPGAVVFTSWASIGSILIFLRIIVSINLPNGTGEFTLFCDGREIRIARKAKQHLPIRYQLIFQVWRRSRHQVWLIYNEHQLPIEDNTYELRVCGIIIPKIN